MIVYKKNKTNLINIIMYIIIYLLLFTFLDSYKLVNDFYAIRLLFPTTIIFATYILLFITFKSVDNKFLKLFFAFQSIFIFILYFVGMNVSGIHFDTWQVFDMSDYIFSDFGMMDFQRQYIIDTHYEMSFPPVLAVLIALPKILIDRTENTINIARFAYLIDEKIGISPAALEDKYLEEFIREFDFTYVYSSSQDYLNTYKDANIVLETTPHEHFYKIMIN